MYKILIQIIEIYFLVCYRLTTISDNDDFDKGGAHINHRWGTVIFFWSVKKGKKKQLNKITHKNSKN